jgi:hypothetical protein
MQSVPLKLASHAKPLTPAIGQLSGLLWPFPAVRAKCVRVNGLDVLVNVWASDHDSSKHLSALELGK